MPSLSCFGKKVIGLAKELDVDDPVLPRQRKRPRRYEASTSEGSFPQTVQDLYWIAYFEALDLLIVASSPTLISLGTGCIPNLKTSLLKQQTMKKSKRR